MHFYTWSQAVINENDLLGCFRTTLTPPSVVKVVVGAAKKEELHVKVDYIPR